MLNKNFYSFVGAGLSSRSYEFRKTDGSSVNEKLISPNLPFDVMNHPIYNHDSNGVCFGTGATPATADDYKLESIITESIATITGQSAVSFNRTTNYIEHFAVFSVANKSTAAITISEIGLIANTYYVNGVTHQCLVDRTVLAEPITIAAGETKQITYTIRFNYGA